MEPASSSVFVLLCLTYGTNGASNILQGPSTRTIVVGPDGSKIEAYAPGGRINLEEHGILVQEAPKAVLHSAKDVEAPEVNNEVATEMVVPQVVGDDLQFPRIWPGGIEVKVVTEEPRFVKGALTIACLVCLAYGDIYEASQESSEEYQDYPDYGFHQYQPHPSNAPPRLVLAPQPRRFAHVPPSGCRLWARKYLTS
nr:unnamed protein product [Callosobruchus chinensis]